MTMADYTVTCTIHRGRRALRTWLRVNLERLWQMFWGPKPTTSANAWVWYYTQVGVVRGD